MKPAVTLKKNHEFRRLYRKGASAVAGSMVLYCRKNRLGHNRLGITVSVKLGNAVKRVLIALVRFYQRNISPCRPRCCNYIPTCSQYAVEALERYGAVKGSWLAFKRILRCNPFHKGGYDPVP